MSDLPTGWIVRTLADFVTTKSGNSKIIKGKQSPVPDDELYQGYSASGPDIWVKSAEYSGPGIVVSAVGARCGKAFLADGEWTAIANTHVIIPGNNIDVKFLWYLINNEHWWIRSGTAQPFVKVKDSLERDMAMPTLEEQKQIVDILEEQLSRLDAGLVSLNRIEHKVLQIARASRRDLIADSLTFSGSEQGTFGDYFKPKYGKSIPKEKRSSDGRYPVVGSAGVMARTNEVLSEGPTIVIGRKGNVGQVEYFEEGCYPIDTTYYIQVTDGWDLQFLEFLLDSLELKNLDSSTATPSLRREDLESISLVKPDIQTQKILLNKLMIMSAGLSSIEEILNQAKLNASSLRRSLLNAAFTGQLTKESTGV